MNESIITYERKTTAAKERRVTLIMTIYNTEFTLASFYAATYDEASSAAHAYRMSEAGQSHMRAAVKENGAFPGTFAFFLAR